MPLQFDEICNQWNMIDTNLSSRLRKTVSILTQKKGGGVHQKLSESYNDDILNQTICGLLQYQIHKNT
jgi:hypothetical protein